MAEDAVSLLFQVAGGGSVNGKSGGIIAGQISSIVKQIEAQGTTKLKFGVDTSGTKAQLSTLTQQMNQVTVANSKIIGSSQTTIARIRSSYDALKSTVKEINKAGIATVSLNKEFNNLAITKGKFDANPTSKTADAYRAQQVVVNDLAKSINTAATAKEKLEQSRNNVDWDINKNALSEQIAQYKEIQKLQSEKNAIDKRLQTTGSKDEGARVELTKQLIVAQGKYDTALDSSKLTLKQQDSILEAEIAHQQQLNLLQSKKKDGDRLNQEKEYNEFLKKNMSDADFRAKQSALQAKQASAQIKARMQLEQEAATAKAKADAEAIAGDKKKINDQLQYNKILSQSRDYYDKYSDNIKKNYQLNKDWQAFNSRLSTDRDFLFSQEARYQLSALQQATREAGADVETFRQKLERLFDAHLSTAVAMVGVHLIQKSLRDIYNNVKEIDTAMTELKKVTEETNSVYAKFLDGAGNRAQKLGAEISDVVQATADFSRLGYNLEDASTFADATLVYKNVGDGIEDVSQASESLISTTKAFGIEASDAMEIVDRFNEVGNNFAVSSANIGVALKKSASALSTANNTLDESIGLIVAGNSVTQNAEITGTALKSLSMRIRGAKAELEEMGESTEGMCESTSKLREEILKLTGQKVDIMLDENTFKSTFQIIKELSSVWDGLSDINQATILNDIAGMKQGNVVSAMIKNFDSAEEAAKTAANSAGSALKENEKQLDSIQGKLTQTKATIQSLSSDVLNSGLVKFVLDLANGSLKAVDGLAKIHMLLPAIALSIATIKSVGRPKVFNINNIEYLDGFNYVPTVA